MLLYLLLLLRSECCHCDWDATPCCIKLIRLTCYLIRHPAGNISIHLMMNAGIINTSAATLQPLPLLWPGTAWDVGHLERSWIEGVFEHFLQSGGCKRVDPWWHKLKQKKTLFTTILRLRHHQNLTDFGKSCRVKSVKAEMEATIHIGSPKLEK